MLSCLSCIKQKFSSCRVKAQNALLFKGSRKAKKTVGEKEKANRNCCFAEREERRWVSQKAVLSEVHL